MRTVKVKIAVAVDPDGSWSASGWGRDGGYNDADAMSLCRDGLGEGAGEKCYWIEAELAVPEPHGAETVTASSVIGGTE